MKMTRFWKSSPHKTYRWANNTVKKSENALKPHFKILYLNWI